MSTRSRVLPGADDPAPGAVGPTGIPRHPATSSTTSPLMPSHQAPLTGRTGQRRRQTEWYRQINWSAAIWVLFLVIPLACLVAVPMSPLVRVPGLAGIV